MGKVVLFQRGGSSDWWETEKATIVKAREEHICDECRLVIYVGEKYISDVFTNVEQTFRHNHKVCLKCWKGPT